LRHHDEFDEDTPGLGLERARGLLVRIHERHKGEGRREVSADPVNGKNYFVLLEHPEQAEMLRAFLKRRGIWFEEHIQLPQPPQPEPPRRQQVVTVGVAFLLVDGNDLSMSEAKGMVQGIAALLHEWSEGAFQLRAGVRREEDPPGYYWVCFNDVPSAQMFYFALREAGVTVQRANSLKGERPELPVIAFDQGAQLARVVSRVDGARTRRERTEALADPDLPPLGSPAMDEGRGFAVIVSGLREKFRRSGISAKMEERFGRRDRPERPVRRRKKP
jgi:hypothetical protein